MLKILKGQLHIILPYKKTQITGRPLIGIGCWKGLREPLERMILRDIYEKFNPPHVGKDKSNEFVCFEMGNLQWLNIILSLWNT